MLLIQDKSQPVGKEYRDGVKQTLSGVAVDSIYKDDNERYAADKCGVCSLMLTYNSLCSQIRGCFNSHVQVAKIEVMKGGYEVGVHALRELVSHAQRDSEKL